MTKSLFLLFALAIWPATAMAQNQQPASPEFKLIQFQMAILKKGPKWSSKPDKEAAEVLKKHVDYVVSLLNAGKVAIAGPFRDESSLAGLYIFRTESADEAKRLVMADPAVIAQQFIPELHPWWAQDVMKKTDAPMKFITTYLAFLVKGEKWTAEQTPETDELQKAHLANIRRLAETKKLVLAGPFGDNGNLRGIFLFRVASLEEARSLALTDPAVQAKRLAFDLHPWAVSEGTLP